jgi:type II secretory ATPase GspE/PulE/Tfp pilus assembly ATPase PilB-like protein
MAAASAGVISKSRSLSDETNSRFTVKVKIIQGRHLSGNDIAKVTVDGQIKKAKFGQSYDFEVNAIPDDFSSHLFMIEVLDSKSQLPLVSQLQSQSQSQSKLLSESQPESQSEGGCHD